MKEEDPLKLSKKLGTVLKKRRKERGIGLQELADMSSVSKLTLINIEKGEANPSLSIMWKLANSLQIPISSLLEEEKSITISRSGKGYQMLSANEACTLETAFHTSHSGKIEMHRAFFKTGRKLFFREPSIRRHRICNRDERYSCDNDRRRDNRTKAVGQRELHRRRRARIRKSRSGV